MPATIFKLMIMNTHGNNDDQGRPSARRKKTIADIVKRVDPVIVLFQEFKWVSIRHAHWKRDDAEIDPTYEYIRQPRHESMNIARNRPNEASIMYNNDEIVEVNLVDFADLQNCLTETINVFNPFKRMTAVKIAVQISQARTEKFVCISWHGRYTEGGTNRLQEFVYLMEFLTSMSESLILPIVIGGDFNIDFNTVQGLVPDSFTIYQYQASRRRRRQGVIDFFICSKLGIRLTSVHSLRRLQRYTEATKPSGILDHDPVMAHLRFTP